MPVTRLSWPLVLFGVATLGVGIFFVASPHETLTVFVRIAGIFLLVDGLLAIVGSIFGRGEGRGLLALVGVFYLGVLPGGLLSIAADSVKSIF